ncbi:MAG: hypothetical protein O7E57_05575 [Gammaproteobacteria bacterium]|nr:hypothetical protein [Gammaproteobacteria bacterium]
MWGAASALWSLPEIFAGGEVRNFVFFGDGRRLPPVEAIELLRSAYVVDFATVFMSAIPFVLVSVLFLAIVRDLYAFSRLRALLAGLFLGASMISGLLLGFTVLRVSAFAFQSTVLSAAEQQWLEGGITFLNQIHLIFLDGWYFFVGLGWIFMGLAASGCGHRNRAIGFIAVTAGAMVLGGVMAAFWRPTYGEMVPLLVASLQNKSIEGGLALGLATSGLLAWSLSFGASDQVNVSTP